MMLLAIKVFHSLEGRVAILEDLLSELTRKEKLSVLLEKSHKCTLRRQCFASLRCFAQIFDYSGLVESFELLAAGQSIVLAGVRRLESIL